MGIPAGGLTAVPNACPGFFLKNQPLVNFGYLDTSFNEPLDHPNSELKGEENPAKTHHLQEVSRILTGQDKTQAATQVTDKSTQVKMQG